MTGPSPPRTCEPIPRTTDPLTTVGGQQSLAPLGEQSGFVGVGQSYVATTSGAVIAVGTPGLGSRPGRRPRRSSVRSDAARLGIMDIREGMVLVFPFEEDDENPYVMGQQHQITAENFS